MSIKDELAHVTTHADLDPYCYNHPRQSTKLEKTSIKSILVCPRCYRLYKNPASDLVPPTLYGIRNTLMKDSENTSIMATFIWLLDRLIYDQENSAND